MTRLERELEASLKEVLSVIFVDLAAPIAPAIQRAINVLEQAEMKRSGK